MVQTRTDEGRRALLVGDIGPLSYVRAVTLGHLHAFIVLLGALVAASSVTTCLRMPPCDASSDRTGRGEPRLRREELGFPRSELFAVESEASHH